MITFDGNRSLSKSWFAKKQIEAIKSLDIPAKAIKWDGFTFKVWQQGDLSGGRVTAPMGAVVARINGWQGLEVSTADFWAGAFTPKRQVGILHSSDQLASEQIFVNKDADEVANLGYSKDLFYPLVVWLQNNKIVCRQPVPGLFPSYGEAFDISCYGAVYNLVDDDMKAIYERTRSFYLQDNLVLQRYRAANTQTDSYEPMFPGTLEPNTDILTNAQQVNEEEQVLTLRSRFFEHSTHGKLLLRKVIIPHGKLVVEDLETHPRIEYTKLEDALPSSIPSEAKTAILNDWHKATEPTCTYVFSGPYTAEHTKPSTNIFAAYNFTGRGPYRYYFGWSSGSLATYWNSIEDNSSSDTIWALFYSIFDGETWTHVNVSQFYDILVELGHEDPALGDGIFAEFGYDWNDPDWFTLSHAWRNQVLLATWQRMTCVWPASMHDDSPFDSVMFHDGAGDIFVWTRYYGMLQFSKYGISRCLSASVPSVVTETKGVRPEIYYAGNDNYVCFANLVQDYIMEVHIGSPFTGWTKMPSMIEGYQLIQCRPVVVTDDEVMLIGVCRSTSATYNDKTGETERATYFVTLVKAKDSAPSWTKLGKLPFVEPYDESLNSYQVCLFGDDMLVEAIRKFPSHPPISGQMPFSLPFLYDDCYTELFWPVNMLDGGGTWLG